MKTISLFFVLFLNFGAVGFHDYYVSLTTIKHNVSESTLQVSIKIFMDDLAFATTGNRTGMPSEGQIKSYIFKKISIFPNHKKVASEPVWIGFETENDVCWIYLEIKHVKKLKNIMIENTILSDVFPQQSNIVQVTANEETKGVILSKGENTKTINF